MNGAQDLGGTQGHGPIRPEVDELPFHAEWERRALAVTLAMGATGCWSIDESRHARETLPPVVYLGSSYYRIWLLGLQKLMLAHGLVNAEELTTGKPLQAPGKVHGKLLADQVAAALARGTPSERQIDTPARFSPGERVRARRLNPTTHTRLPRYVRGCVGTIVTAQGAHVFPDAHAHGLGEAPQWLYTVRFAAYDLWGSDTTADAIHVDCWESYLAPEPE